jgi:hypothetical protein
MTQTSPLGVGRKLRFKPVLFIFAAWVGGAFLAAPGIPQVFAANAVKSGTGVQLQAAARARLASAYGNLPLSFTANDGQAGPEVKFLSRGSGYTLFLTANEAVLALSTGTPGARDSEAPAPSRNSGAAPGRTRSAATPPARSRAQATREAVLRMEIAGANRAARVTGLDELPGKTDYFIGRDARKWRTNVPNYARVKYEGIYPGIDLVYYGNHRQLEYDFTVAPGANPGAIRLRVPPVSGHTALHISKNGDLVMRLATGEVSFHKPVVYQPQDSRQASAIGRQSQQTPNSEARPRSPVDARYVLNGNQVRFEIGRYDRTRPLIIDPVLTYSSLLGGSGFYGEWGSAIAVDSSGNVYLTGQTDSTDFPNVNQISGACVGYCDSGLYTEDAFVTKIDAAGDAIVYSSFIGGSNTDGPDYGTGIAVDSSGAVYLTGVSNSSDFPEVNQIPGACNDSCYISGAAFVAKIDAAGDALDYSSMIGGEYYDSPSGIAVDSSGDAYLTGWTDSTDFPVINQISGACDSTCGTGNPVAFVTEVNAAGTALDYSTLLGGDIEAYGNAIALDGSGNVYVAGYTNSTDFPQVNPTSGACVGACGSGNGYYDGFVTEINAAGNALTYSSLIGGSEGGLAEALALDSSGNIYLGGYTTSADFPQVSPIPGACEGTCGTGDGANPDVFVAKINAGGSALVYSSLLGGSGAEEAYGLAVDASGNAYLTGQTSSTDFPLLNPISGACQAGCGGGPPVAFITEVQAGASALVYSSYLGGNTAYLGDSGAGIRVDGQDNVYLTGYTTSTNFPEVNQISGACNGTCGTDGNFEVIAVKISASNQNDTYTFPESLAFTPKRAKTQRIILTNSRHAPLSISRIAITGADRADFSQSNNCPRTLRPGGFCTVTVTFFPHQSGGLTATLGVQDSAPGSPQTVSLFGE